MSGLVSTITGDHSSDDAMAQLKKNQQIWNNLQTPDLKWQDYKPETYNAEMMNADTVKEDPALRSSQMDVLSKMAGLSKDGLSDVDAAGYQKSRDEAQQIAQGQSGAALANAESRGLSGSGMEFAAKEMAGQSAANRAQSADLQQAADSARQRAMYTQAYGGALAGQRSQDFGANAANTNILNQFNQANTQARNNASYGNVQNQNQAQMYNNQGRTGIQQQNFNNQVTRAGGMSGANTGMANGYAAQDAANTGQFNSIVGTGARLGAAYMMGGTKTASGAGNSAGSSGMDYSGYAAHGGIIPGQAPVPGDSMMNDTVKMNLSPGEMVIPRSHAQTPHLAKAFVEHLFGKK